MSSAELTDQLLADPSFQAWVLGRADEETAATWTAWVSEAPPTVRGMRQEAARRAARILHLFAASEDKAPAPEAVDAAWRRLHAAHQATAPEAWPPTSAPSSRWASGRDKRVSRAPAARARPARRARSHWRLQLLRVAASIVAVSLVAVGIWSLQPSHTPMEVVTTDAGERTTLTLADGSRIVLNAQSALRYNPEAMAQGTRQLWLDGEALFEVTPHPERSDPAFRVVTPDGTVRVLGTIFSVAHRDDQTRVVLREGRVAVEPQAAAPVASAPDTTVTLSPGDMLTFDAQTQRLARQRVDPAVHLSWSTGTLVFDDTPLAEILARLRHTYGLAVEVRDSTALRETVSGTVANDRDALLQGLSRILDRRIEQQDRRIIVR
jgi:ferric-dicitrate binding protein FerR (iron transport regulator)